MEMKKHGRIFALLLTAVMLISIAACAGCAPANITDDLTSAPDQTTVGTDDVTSDTTSVEEVSTAPIETAPPEAEDVLMILKQSGQSISSLFDDEENRTLANARADRFLREHSSAAVVREVTDIVAFGKTAATSGETGHDLLMLDTKSGAKLLIGAYLENLDEAGISINSDTVGVRKELTEELTFGGTYLVACDALSSYLSASYALKYNGSALSSDPVAAALDGTFTVELMLQYIAEQGGECLAVDDISPLVLYRGVGGRVFEKDGRGLPISALTLTNFPNVYTAACDLYNRSSSINEGVFRLAKVGDDTDAVWLPIPKADASAEYSTPLDTTDVVLFGATVGVIDGARLHTLFTAYNLVSSDHIEAARAKLTHADRPHSAELAAIIGSTASIDLGTILGWGDIDDVLASGLSSNTKISSLLNDRVVQMQNEAVEAAAAIVAGKLEID